MADPRLVCAKVSFSVLAILSIAMFTIYEMHKYFLDEDWSYGTYKTFHDDINDVYPSISLCISDNNPGENIKLFHTGYSSKDSQETDENKNETMISYQNFLEGRCINDDANCRWNESFYKIDYDLVTLSIEDYILGLSVFHKNGSKYWFGKGNNSNNSSLLFSWPLKAYINKREAHQKCLTLDIPYTKNSQLHSIGVLFNLSMFGGNGVRPESGGFSIKLHYPQQILVSNTEKVRWVKALSLEDCSSSSLENDNCFDSYTMFFDIKNVEVISRRNKRKRKCMRDWEMGVHF